MYIQVFISMNFDVNEICNSMNWHTLIFKYKIYRYDILTLYINKSFLVIRIDNMTYFVQQSENKF